MKKLLTAGLLILSASLMAQNQDTRSTYRYRISKSKSPIIIDGVDDEETWQTAAKIGKLLNHWPSDTGDAEALTEVWVSYDDEFVYVLARLYDNGERVVQSLRRDNIDSHWNSDNFTVIIDPFNNKQSGFFFGLNAGGAQVEALMNVENGETNFDENWDNKWYSEVRAYENYWLVEMAIPFKTLRYNSTQTEWGINFIRGDMERNHYSTWTQFPISFGGIDMNFMGTLEWDAAPKKAEGKVVLIPYVAGSTQRDYENEEGQTGYTQELSTGLDAKVAITGSLNLDLTVNPDFSNADVDQQVTNLSRFSIFFPERRNFFLENGDIFSNFGSWQIQPFFSRTIGLHEGQQVPIRYGARLTGNLTPNLRIGAMNVQTGSIEELEANNYSVIAGQQRVFSRSVIKGIFINRNGQDGDFGRNGGLEFNYVHPSGSWNNTFRYHMATNEENPSDNSFYGFDGGYRDRNLAMGWTFDVVGRNYVTEQGFNPRLYNYNAETEESERQGYTRINPWFRYRFIPENENSKLAQHGVRTWHMAWLNTDGSLNERRHGVGYDLIFKNTSEFRINRLFFESNLPVPINLIGEGENLPVANYKYADNFLFYSSDRRKIINTEISLRHGTFYNGTKSGFTTGLNFRTQPWGTFGVTYDYNKVKLAEGYGESDLHLFRLNAEISFSNKMFWTTAVQYNSQAENYNIFSRFQWRYKPMSDIFIVYTDNYGIDGLNIKNRQIVFKVTYWLNM
ncbi:DUF5916 domain-containing protein [Roseivirga sp.]|uniref:carbohydrate binding family 9 domain-containing protein n=1 Tax=Roseivirga sp. TaxID=1964215 RepID=UPI003B51F097